MPHAKQPATRPQPADIQAFINCLLALNARPPTRGKTIGQQSIGQRKTNH